MGAIQPWHLIIILIIVLIVFGPGKLPDLGKSLGQSIREFRSATQDDGKANAAQQQPQPPAAPGSSTDTTSTPGGTPAP